jgi:hypothetical protein
LGFGLTSSFAVSFEGCVFLVCLSQPSSISCERISLLAAACFAAVAIGADGWVLSVERCQTQTPSFQSLWQFQV